MLVEDRQRVEVAVGLGHRVLDPARGHDRDTVEDLPHLGVAHPGREADHALDVGQRHARGPHVLVDVREALVDRERAHGDREPGRAGDRVARDTAVGGRPLEQQQHEGDVIVNALCRIADATPNATRPASCARRRPVTSKPRPSSRKPSICESFQITAIIVPIGGNHSSATVAIAAPVGASQRRIKR